MLSSYLRVGLADRKPPVLSSSRARVRAPYGAARCIWMIGAWRCLGLHMPSPRLSGEIHKIIAGIDRGLCKKFPFRHILIVFGLYSHWI
jgi:hypothetical protein